MFGAIIGDVVGSIYEYNNINTKDFNILNTRAFRTDDTVLTCAVAELLNHLKPSLITPRDVKTMFTYYGNKYPNEDYGLGYRQWLASADKAPYNSCGNGSAMRISPVGWVCDSLEETERLSDIITGVTHNHQDGLNGARAVAGAIWIARHTGSKQLMKDYVSKYYDVDFSYDDIDPKQYATLPWICKSTVPQAFVCFYDSNNFEDAIRNAISIGGDSDTVACITGALAEAFYPSMPTALVFHAYNKLPAHLQGVVKDFYSKFV